MKKRALTLLLALCMVLSLLPALAPQVQAAEIKLVYSMAELKGALEASGDANITVMDEIIASDTISQLGSTYITLGSGKKTIDLNGQKVEANATGAGRFTFLRVPAGAELIVKDNSAKGTGKLWSDGDMVFARFTNLPYYYNSDVRYRDTIVVDGGSFTLESGEIEAGRAKEVWVYNGHKVEKWYQQLNYALQGGALAWAIGVRFDGNAYQIVNGDAVTLNSGSVTINGGKLTGKGYRDMGTEFNASEFKVYFKGAQLGGTPERCAALHAVGGKVTINGGQIYGMANANALESSNSVDVKLNAGTVKTQRLNKVILPNFGHGGAGNYQTNQFVADSSDYDDKGSYMHQYCGGAGNLGVKEDYLDGNYFAWYDGNPIEKAQWSNSKFYSTAYSDGHTLSVSRNTVNSTFASVSLALEEPKAIVSVDLPGTMAQGMTLTQDTIKCDSSQVSSVTALWYRDNELITGAHEVRFGNYLAKVTVYPAKGHRFTSNTKFTLLGDEPLMTSAASDGSYAVLWSQLYKFQCDHSCNEDWSVHYDNLTHYQQCSVCGERILEEPHGVAGGIPSGSKTIYKCPDCGYSYEEENGRIKIDYVVADIPLALSGEAIPTPALTAAYGGMAKVTSWEIVNNETDAAVQPGSAYESGTSYSYIVRVQAEDGYYFSPSATLKCGATTIVTSEANDNVLIGKFKAVVYTPASATVTTPSMTPGMTMEEYVKSAYAVINGRESGNVQITVKKLDSSDPEVFVKNFSASGWSLVRGADSLEAFFARKIEPETRYKVSFDFSTNGLYVPTENVKYLSPASYEGYTLKGGNTWISLKSVMVSDSDKVSDVSVVSVMTPFAGNAPEVDFDVLNPAALEPVSGAWDASEVFEYGTEYTFTATAKLKEGFRFAKEVTASVNGAVAQITVSGNTATVSYTFPATEQKVEMVKGPELESVAITTPPAKTEYKAGEVFDPAGMVVTITYQDGSTAPFTGYQITPAGALKTTDTAVVLTCTVGENTQYLSQSVTVTAGAVTIVRQAIPATGTAYANTQEVELDGKKVTIPTYALKDEKGYLTNYVRVRDLAVLLEGTAGNYDVDWNSADGIVLTSHHAYEKAHYNGTEGKIPFAGDQGYKAYAEDTLVDGAWQSLTAFQIVYNGGAHTYYQLRDLGKALGFNVGWSKARGMFLETDKPYTDAD